MKRPSLVAMTALAVSGCDIVGHVPQDERANVEAFVGGCSGANRVYALFVSVDVTMSSDDQVAIQWFLSTSSSNNVQFRPNLDCGLWSGGFGSNGGGLDLVPDPGQGTPDYAFCVRGDGPPREIVTLRGTATLPATASSTDSLLPEFDVSTLVDGTSAQPQRPSCVN
ncbi:hypothetical protein BH11MYX2_BH11MYX2_14130 [soil metagenome]